MSHCCCPEKSGDSNSTRCPQSGSVGRAVELQTVKALLRERALGRLVPGEYRFCLDADCDVVYFDGCGTQFGTDDVRVPVWHKLSFGIRPMCYCFGESEASIRSEIETTGRSSAVERIRGHISAGRCACDVRNPRGACCLGDVIAAIKRVTSAMEMPSEIEAAPVTKYADA